MKKVTLTILLLTATIISLGQNRQDQAQVLQKCMDLPDLQQYYPVDSDGSQKPLIIQYWHPVFFPTDLILTKEGKKVEFRPMSSESENNADAYFLFEKFEIQGNTSRVEFGYYKNPNHQEMIGVTLDLNKVGAKWEISAINISNHK